MVRNHRVASARTSPHELARTYDRYAAALWRVDEAEPFATWLEGYWADEGPPEEADHPHVISLLGGAGAGIHWHARGRTIVGYIGSCRRGFYQVRVDAAPPPIHSIHVRP